MKGWIKYFADGSRERGVDSAVRQGNASWTRGRLKYIIKAESHHDRYIIRIIGIGDYHQSDDCEAKLFQSQGRVVVRRLQKKLDIADKFVITTVTPHELNAEVMTNIPKLPSLLNGAKREIISIKEDNVGKWLTLELDILGGEMRLRITESRI